jgi:hypothetical protein
LTFDDVARFTSLLGKGGDVPPDLAEVLRDPNVDVYGSRLDEDGAPVMLIQVPRRWN